MGTLQHGAAQLGTEASMFWHLRAAYKLNCSFDSELIVIYVYCVLQIVLYVLIIMYFVLCCCCLK